LPGVFAADVGSSRRVVVWSSTRSDVTGRRTVTWALVEAEVVQVIQVVEMVEVVEMVDLVQVVEAE